jgi:hypothetical protein
MASQLFIIRGSEKGTDEKRYDPIQKFGPQDCVASINAIVEKMDLLVESKNQAAIRELKAIFGLQDLEDIRDFAMTIAFPRTLLPLSTALKIALIFTC